MVVQLRRPREVIVSRLKMEWAQNIEAILSDYPASPHRPRSALTVAEIIARLRYKNAPLRAMIAIAERNA